MSRAFQQLGYLEENQKNDNDFFLKSLSDIANHINSIDIKIEFFDHFYHRYAYDAYLLNNYGDALAKNGEYERAYALFDQSLRQDDKESITLFLYANALEMSQQYSDAIDKMKVIKVNDIPNNLKNYMFLRIGRLYFFNKDYPLAKKYFERIDNHISQHNILRNITQELLGNSLNRSKINQHIDGIITSFEKEELKSIAHIIPMKKSHEIYNDKAIESQLNNEKEMNSAIFHKLNNHISLIKITFDFIIKKNYSDETTKNAKRLIKRVSKIFVNINEMREKQKRLENKIGALSLKEIEEKLVELGEEIADKINNSLSNLSTSIGLLQKKGLIDEKRLEKLKKQLSTAMAVANDLRVINSPTHLVISEFSVNDVFENIENNMTLDNVTLKLSIKNSKKLIYGDKNKIKEIISELVGNSINHNENKKITIKITSSNKANPYIGKIKHKGEFLYISFTDNGKGIVKDKKEWVFLATKTTLKDGSGLGLYIIKKSLESMRGYITENGKYGVRFNLYIPYDGGSV